MRRLPWIPLKTVACFHFLDIIIIALGAYQGDTPAAFSACLCMCIIDKPPVFDGRVMGDQRSWLAATALFCMETELGDELL